MSMTVPIDMITLNPGYQEPAIIRELGISVGIESVTLDHANLVLSCITICRRIPTADQGAIIQFYNYRIACACNRPLEEQPALNW